ncbi:CD276 antigen homolog [Centropristis striata]|uniref:CD276 antigen homolog n=1 Tax=Centropristis striata TaxID=184440 RepID=UPI0027E03FEB|nr:CD276 antigen homolog [Centropristis striata]
MFVVSVAYFLLLVSEATVVLDVNTTVGESMTFPCTLTIPATAALKNLRFYWQDKENCVLYSFNEGREMPNHVHKLYRGRVTAFSQEMIRGNVSVKLNNITLQDNQKVFEAFASVFESGGTKRYTVPHGKICQVTLHVAVPYKSVNLAVHEESMTADCTTKRGFPKPLVTWRFQHLYNKSQHLLDPRDVDTTAEQDPEDHLYRLKSTIEISGGPYQSVTCLIHNPTLNVTLIATHVLNNSEAEWSLPGWAGALIAAAAAVLIPSCGLLAYHVYRTPRRARQPSSSPDTGML